jgi:hypothetical protein
MPNFSGVWNLKEQIQAIAAGRWTGIAYGRVVCLGFGNKRADLVTALPPIRSSPVQVATTNWSQVSAGGNRTMAITTDGSSMLGARQRAQHGDGTTVDKSQSCSDWSSNELVTSFGGRDPHRLCQDRRNFVGLGQNTDGQGRV